MAAVDEVNRVFRENRRYTGDGLPNEPAGAPLPVGDPSSGVHSPKKSEIRTALLDVLTAPTEDAERAEAAAAEAAAAADLAEGYAAGVNISGISPGDAGGLLVVKDDESGSEWISPEEARLRLGIGPSQMEYL